MPNQLGSLGAGGGAAAATTLILDQFTDTDSTALASHTIAPTNTPATSWTVPAGSYTITSNRAVSGGANSFAHCNPGKADITASVIVQLVSAANDGGLALRFTDITHFWSILLSAAGDNLFRIFEFNGSATERASASLTVTASVDYTVAAVASGQTISATVNGANGISYGSATTNQTTTVHGLRSVQASNQFDTFTVIG